MFKLKQYEMLVQNLYTQFSNKPFKCTLTKLFTCMFEELKNKHLMFKRLGGQQVNHQLYS